MPSAPRCAASTIAGPEIRRDEPALGRRVAPPRGSPSRPAPRRAPRWSGPVAGRPDRRATPRRDAASRTADPGDAPTQQRGRRTTASLVGRVDRRHEETLPPPPIPPPSRARGGDKPTTVGRTKPAAITRTRAKTCTQPVDRGYRGCGRSCSSRPCSMPRWRSCGTGAAGTSARVRDRHWPHRGGAVRVCTCAASSCRRAHAPAARQFAEPCPYGRR